MTPGPWKWFNDGDLANEEGHMVLRPDANRGVPTDEDAALIAAAPDFLAACEMMLAELEEQNAMEGMALTITEKDEWLTPGFRAMVKAIRKARATS